MTQQQLDDLAFLIEKGREVQPSRMAVEEQRRSFAFGNAAFENHLITREMIAEEAELNR